MTRVLIVDDEPDVLKMLRNYFELSGYEVLLAADGETALQKAGRNPDIILLDINIPKMDGLEVCKRIRQHVSCPILFLTAYTEDADKIRGFSAGGDDYITKPFSLDELGARISAHLRRELRQQKKTALRFSNDLTLDYSSRAVFYQEKQIPLSKKEFDIVELLSLNAGIVFDKERIYERLWGYDSDGNSMTVVEHIRKIRSKFAEAGCGSFIKTIWGSGYKWEN
ncbi:MAG: response regulator transcription factor [Eubacterium sp.]|nr:response regulator transcription factor [Lachnospiraceae bacterium]MBQ9872531.1 response regulator transcription factor [Eubacterium sp.]